MESSVSALVPLCLLFAIVSAYFYFGWYFIDLCFKEMVILKVLDSNPVLI